MRARLLPPLAALAAALALPAASPAAVTVGSNLAGTGTDNLGGYCPGAGVCTGTNLSLPAASTAANGLTSPIDGVVVRWRVKSGSAGNAVALRVLRQGAGTTFTGAGTSTPGTTVAGVAETASRVRVRAGESIGLNISNSALVWANTPGATGVVWGSVNGFPTGLADGQSASGDGQTAKELLVQAVIEADADGDGFGDETQDGCPGDASRQTPPCATGERNPRGNPPAPPIFAPRIAALRVTPASFRLDTVARIRFVLSKPSTVRLTFDQLVAGRRRGARCLRQTRTVRTGRRCTAYVRRGVRVRGVSAGRRALVFRGRIARRALPLGRYRLTVGATDRDGNVARTRSTRFTLRAALLRRG